MKGARNKLIREHNERAWLAYHVAFLPRMKRPPDFKKFLYKDRTKRQTWQEQLQIAKLWHSALSKKKGKNG